MADEQVPVNYLSAELGASVVEVSHEAETMGSVAANALVDREDHIWIADPPPQHVTVALPQHPPIRYIGWYVWHDYLTNPKVVEVTSGADVAAMQPLITCTAYAGSGVQLWELPEPLPASHRLVRFKVVSTFGGSYTYVNRWYAFSEHPGNRFAAKVQQNTPRRERAHERPSAIMAAARSPGGMSDVGSPYQMSALLRDLDHDIRALHPLRANVPPSLNDLSQRSHSSRTAAPPVHSDPEDNGLQHSTTDITLKRIAVLEQSVAGLVRAVEEQGRDLRALREGLLQGGGSNHTSFSRGDQSGFGPQAVVDASSMFPEAALRTYVEDVMAPKLAKHSRRFEARVTQRMDEHLEELLRNVSAAVDEHVSRHMRRIAANMDESYRNVSRPSGASSRHTAPRR
jgi:hypothetical protein